MAEISSSSVTDLLFVYGTLMRGNRSPFAAQLHQHSTYVGTGWFWGRLYRVDWYPGGVRDLSAQTRVWGEVYELQRSGVLLSQLDAYEGVNDDPPVYNRCVVPVFMNGRTVNCQTYLYALPTEALVLIESGHFLPMP